MADKPPPAPRETPAQVDSRIENVVQLTLENWESIGVEESGDGVLHLPITIRKRGKTGALVEQQVWIRNVSNAQRFKARTRSREWAHELGLDLDRDSDLVEDLEKFELLAYAVRGETFEQHVTDGKQLAKMYEPTSLEELYGRWEAWTRMLHPSFGTWNAEELWQVVARVRAGSNLTPLAVMPGRAQANCIVFMAREAALSPNAPSWLGSSGTSTPAP